VPKIVIKREDLHKAYPLKYCSCGHRYEDHDEEICFDCGFPCWSMCEYETYISERD